MTAQGVLGPGMTGTTPQQAQPNLGGNSHQTWLRELERAQAGMLGSHADAGRDKHKGLPSENVDTSIDTNKPLAPGAVAQAPVVASWIAPQGPQTTVMSTQSLPPMQTVSLASLPSRFYVGTVANGMFVRETDTLDAVNAQLPEVGDTRPGREEREFSRNSFKLVRSGEESVDAAIRDPEITLESELRLGHQIRTVVQAAGSKLGKVWLNGRAVMDNSQGEKNGN